MPTGIIRIRCTVLILSTVFILSKAIIQASLSISVKKFVNILNLLSQQTGLVFTFIFLEILCISEDMHVENLTFQDGIADKSFGVAIKKLYYISEANI